MVVKKQLINSIDNIKKQGIIGCVQLIDAMARIANNGVDRDEFIASVENVDSLPDGRGKMAANLISNKVLTYLNVYINIFSMQYAPRHQ